MEANEISIDDNMEFEKKDYASKLPFEIIVHMMKFLNYSDRKCARLVNRRWLEASLYPTFLNQDFVTFTKDLDDGKYPLTVIMNSSRPFYHLKFLNMKLNEVKQFWIEKGSNIRSLVIRSHFMTYKHLSFILSHCPNLKKLEVSVYDDVLGLMDKKLDETSFSKTLPNLKELRVFYKCSLSKHSMALFDRFISMAPNLEILGFFHHQPSKPGLRSFPVFDCGRILKSISRRKSTLTSLSFELMIANNIPEFTKLMGYSEINLKQLALSDKFIRLSQIAMTFTDFMTISPSNSKISVMTDHQTTLTALDLCHEIFFSDEHLIKICDTLPLLSKLRITECDNLTDVGVSSISRLANLEELDISDCRNVTSKGIFDALCQRTNKLIKWLNLSTLENLDEKTVVKLTECVPNLVNLNLSGCDEAVTDRSVQAIIQRLTFIKVLNLNECDKITDAGLTGLNSNLVQNIGFASIYNKNSQDLTIIAKDELVPNEVNSLTRLKGLRELHLNDCRKLTDTSLEAFKFLELQKLHMDHCLKITDKGLGFVGDQNPSLEEISFCECDNITHKGVLRLVKPLKRVKILDLQNCKQLKQKSSTTIFSDCKTLKELLL